MDFEDIPNAAESEAFSSIEFNNQTTLKQETVDSKDNIQVHGQKNSWNEVSEPTQSPISSFAIPLPPPPSKSPSAPWFSEPESDFARPDLADDLEALFSSSDNRADHLGDLIDVGAEAGVCGLRNLGNTCFMSTGVQCLMATPALVHCLLHQPPPHLPSDSLTSHLSLLTHKMWSGQYSAVQPSDFKEMLGAHYPQFKDFRQHDCQEFLALLLDGLHEQMNSSSLHNKLHKMFEVDYDVENHSKVCSKQVPNGICINVSPNHNNLKENNDSKTVNKSEMVLGTPKMDKKINNCEVDENVSPEPSSKLPLIVNMYKNDPTDSLVKNDQVLSMHNKTKDPLPPNVLNNCSPRLSGFEDIIKDAKTSNVNVLVTEQEANNEIRFDSEKFPKSENVRRRETFNFNSFHLYENNMTSAKRGKSTVTHYKSTVDFREGLDLKRLKMQRNEQVQDEQDSDTIMDCDWEKNHRMEDERRHRVSTKNLDKNYRMECERKCRDGPGPSSSSGVTEMAQAEIDPEAEIHWQKHLAAHKSVIVDTFQGQFKSTVVCSTCKHVSVTYEPFMYLSVPLPHALERQLSVTFVAAKENEPVQYLLTVNKRDTVAHVKEQLLHLIGRPVSFMVLAEVLDYHIAKVLDDNHLVRYINSTNRDLYAFELANFSRFAGLDPSVDSDKMVGCEPIDDLSGDACTICLEEKDSNMSQHIGCSCILCDSCIVRSSQHYGDESLKCPVCRKELTLGDNLVTIGLTPDTKPPVRMLNVPLVFRLDNMGDGNNMRTVQLFGHPRLLRLPNHLQCQQLHEAVASLMPYSQQYKILLVDGQGHHCSRCMFHAHCRGCPVEAEGSLVLRAGDCLAAMFVEPVPEILAVQHTTMLQSSVNSSITLYDCIQAFSQSEILDEHNPWYCPSCKKNQCATKTLSVWRYPNYLMIYLKRFVFQDCVSTKLDDKVTFPLRGLNLPPSSSLYDLYACVCHVGGVSAGHYTAYTQHPRTGEWHHYNDDCVTKQPPQEEDFSNAYILFYKKRGADMKNEDFNAKLTSMNGENFS